MLALPEEELLPENAVLCELLLSAPFEALLEPDEAVEEEAEEPPQPVSTAADRMAQTARDAIFVRFIINYSFFC